MEKRRLDPEVPLSGGRYTANVVRVGDTVRRPTLPTSAYIAALLEHLEASGFRMAPKYLGRDDQDRETFSYIPGEVTEKWRQYSDEAVSQAGKWLRAFHDATRHSKLVRGCPVVCHNDPGPNNAVFHNGRLTAFIDFDLAAPGDPLEDLGYMAWSWCVSSSPSREPISAQAAQVRLLLESYGVTTSQRSAIIPAMIERQSRNVDLWQARATNPPQAGLLHVSGEKIEEIVQWSLRERLFTEKNCAAFRAALA